MRWLVYPITVIVLTVAVSHSASAQQKGAGAPKPVEVCKLLPKEEVKKHLPWQSMFDQMELEEVAIGTTGSSCGYPTVEVQVMLFTKGFVDAARKTGTLENIAGLGDEAYFRNNKNEYAEVFVRIGSRLLTLQADADNNVNAAKPKVISLAKVYVEKLRGIG